jgi:hypothetical protein
VSGGGSGARQGFCLGMAFWYSTLCFERSTVG